MASRVRREARLTFETLSIEGGLLSPEWLARVAQLGAGQQSEGDYRVPKGLSLRDEIGRYWRIAHASWKEFSAGLEHRTPGPNDLDRRRALTERFIGSLLRDVFGFVSLEAITPIVIDGRRYPIPMAALNNRVPVVVTAAGEGIESASATFGDGGRRRSPFGLAQEYLNAAAGATWGIVSDGHILRLLRDNASLTRPAWIQADLLRMFSEERYADFAAFWLLAHESRFVASDREDGTVAESLLDTWRSAGQNEGTRAREDLRDGFRDALLSLGQGFLSHPDNGILRAALHGGALTRAAYFQQLLRLVYRLIFLLTVEERDLLHPPGTPDHIRRLYAAGYALQRLRERSLKRNAHDRFVDLWSATTIVFRGLAGGEPRLGLPALAGLFASNQCPDLDRARLENRSLLTAMYRLAWLKQAAGVARVNWRDMGPEELGSVYESLLELQPQITQEGRVFAFAQAGEAKGNARKTTGSYYTPDSLVQVLLDSALEPIVADAISKNPNQPADALLALSIVDPACGSGHFLLAAARRLAGRVARLRAESTPSAAEYRRALRQVIGRCIFGVDLNPMAVELCKVSLWMEAIEPGLPLTFLNSHVQAGNALLGTTPALMAQGIPDAAWEPIEGDDRKVAVALKKRNKAETAGYRVLPFGESEHAQHEVDSVARAIAGLEAAGDDSVSALASKEMEWAGILDSPDYRHQKFVADAWCAAFVWPKHSGDIADAAPTYERWRRARDGEGQLPPLTTKAVQEIATQYRFFHWHLQFPQVFAKGGFDLVVGNPPWDSVLFREEEFFADVRPDIAQASTAASRKRLVAKLETEDPALFAGYRASLREVNGINAFVRSGVRYPLCGVGRVNLFALFAEAARTLASQSGRVGQILPAGIVSDDSTKYFFQALVDGHELAALFHFENEAKIFPGVHHAFRFVLLVLDRSGVSQRTEMQFFSRSVADLAATERRFSLTGADFALLNPLTKTCPIFRTRRDAELTKSIYMHVPVLALSGWELDLRRLLNSADDSDQFVSAPGPNTLPLYEGKYFHHYDHRWVTNDEQGDRALTDAEREDPYLFIVPRHWFPTDEARARFGGGWKHSWVLAWRDITGTEKQRTFIAAVVPSLAVTHTAKVFFANEEQLRELTGLIANLGAFSFDFVSRQKIGGTHMSSFIVEQLPFFGPTTYQEATSWNQATPLRDWILPRVLELTYTAWDLEPFARDIGYDGPPFRWNSSRRFLLRCELDAAFFHLYGFSHDDTEYVMDSFPVVRKNDERAYGIYRTKNAILEIYDAMAEAARTARTYQSRLDPPAADARISHSPRVTLPVIPEMPSVVPSLAPSQDGAILIWAILHADQGAILRSDLARAFALRNRPELLTRLAPAAVRAVATQWAKARGTATMTGTLAGVLSDLAGRSGVDVAIDAEGRSMVKLNANAPALDRIEEWYRFEASLVVHVLKSLPATNVAAVDAAVAGDDRALLVS